MALNYISNFQSRFREALDRAPFNASVLAERIGLSRQAISAYLTGVREPKRPTLKAIAEQLDVNEAWLMGYDVPMRTTADIPTGFEPLPDMSVVPRVGRIACGDPITAEENIESYDSVPSNWKAHFTLVCVGDSMLPRIQDGDLVAIHKQPQVENGEIAAVRIDGEATLKHVYLYPDKIILQPENPAFEPIALIKEEMNRVTIEGKAVGLCRRI